MPNAPELLSFVVVRPLAGAGRFIYGKFILMEGSAFSRRKTSTRNIIEILKKYRQTTVCLNWQAALPSSSESTS
jgi:hypothetical protein